MCLYWYDEHDDVCNSVLSLVKSSAVKWGFLAKIFCPNSPFWFCKMIRFAICHLLMTVKDDFVERENQKKNPKLGTALLQKSSCFHFFMPF